MANNILHLKQLPSPKGHFLLGHLPQFKAANKHQVLERWVEECGPVFRIHFVGKPFIVSANPELNSEILRLRPDKFRRLSKMHEVLAEMGVVGVFNAEGEVWKRHRKITSEALNLKKVKSFYPVILEKTEQLLSKWQQYAAAGQGIDVQKEFMAYTVDITTAIAFGYRMDSLNNQEDNFQKQLEYIFPMINERITAPLPLWRYFKRKKDRQLEASLQAIKGLVYRFIAEAKARLEQQPSLKENPSNFLEAMLVEQEKEALFSDAEIYGNVFTMLLAGEDTTSNSLSWAFYYLAQHPEIVAKVRAEAEAVYGADRVPKTDEAFSQLRYAQAVAQEAIRLKPVAPQLYVQANEDITLYNYALPKGVPIMMQTKVAQTQEQHFSEAQRFIPERWLAGGCPMHTAHNADMIKAFGGGPRFCPGKNLAMHEMTVAISALCKQFDWEMAVKPEEVEELFAFTMFPKNLWLKCKRFAGILPF